MTKTTYSRSCQVLLIAPQPFYTVRGTPLNVFNCQIEDILIPGEARREKVEELRNRFGLSGRRVLGYTGNIQPYQGIDLAQAAKDLVEQRYIARVFEERLEALYGRTLKRGALDKADAASECSAHADV